MPQHARINAFAVGLLAIVTTVMAEQASALTASAGTLRHQLRQDGPVVEVVVRRGGAARRTTVALHLRE
jgi:hypothetical protein